jgi:two-component system, LuxR family, response regulator FixJ
MAEEAATVFVVDDDPAMRKSLERLCESVALPVESHATALEFLEHFDPARPGCIVLDVRLPGLSGLELQERLLQRGSATPVIIITGFGDVPMAVRAMKAGALDFIEKPFAAQTLIERVQAALDLDANQRATRSNRDRFHAALSLLTRREEEVLRYLVKGRTVKQVATDLGLSHKTVQVHRARALDKMQAGSMSELVRWAVSVGYA